MAFPIFIPDHLVVPPPAEHIENNLVKHVIMKGQDFQSFAYKPIQETLILQHLRNLKGPEVLDSIMVVTFHPHDKQKENTSAMNVVRRGVCLEGACYRFLGHSDAQLLEKTCLLIHDSDLAIYDYFEKFSDFYSFKSLSKRAECIGVLFTGFDKTLPLCENDYFTIDDVKRGSYKTYNFSPGCGFMSMQFATEIKQLENLDYTPCVARVVYQGYSGILVVRSDLSLVKVEFRESMRKFTFAHKDLYSGMTSLGVIDHSRPYSNGYLDTQDVMLLADGGVSREYLSQLQDEYFTLLENLLTSKSQASYYLQITGHEELLQKLNTEGMEPILEDLKKLQEDEIQKMKENEQEESTPGSSKKPNAHLKILVPKSRVVFGACDPFELLECGECYFNPTLTEEEERQFSEVDRVVVFRESSYYPGDIRVLKVQRKHPEFNQHKDCIIFPVQGSRPHALECGGADLSGDKFFVSWDPNLIPRWRTSPYSYVPNAIAHLGGRLYEQGFQLKLRERTKDYFHSVFGYSENYAREMKIKQRQELAEYFASYDTHIVDKFNEIFMKYASARGPSSKECRHLHHIFSRAVRSVGRGEELHKIIAQYEEEYKSLSRPTSKPRRCCLVNLLIRNGWIKPFFDPGDDVWNSMGKSASKHLQHLEDIPQKNTETADTAAAEGKDSQEKSDTGSDEK